MKTEKNNKKISLLKEGRNFNAHFAKVTHQLFLKNDFFDPQDMVQVKYEMLRCARLQKVSIKDAAKSFGFSRPAFYQAQASFEQNGLAGLVPQKRGPKNRHKLSSEVMKFINDAVIQDPTISKEEVVRLIKKQYSMDIHARSITRALNAQKAKSGEKKKPQTTL